MARASQSLKDEIGRQRSNIDNAFILEQIANGLIELGEIVHRDLKPGNILKHQGCWKIADFGISRFSGKDTSQHTLKSAKTPSYAAPEQWRYERATHATDIYALGCIGYELITGAPPFQGPSIQDYALQHQTKAPSAPGGPSSLSVLILKCLSKSPSSRPRLQTLPNQLRGVASARNDTLMQAAVAVAQSDAETEAAKTEANINRRKLSDTIADGKLSISTFIERFLNGIRNDIPNAFVTESTAKLGMGDLHFVRISYQMPSTTRSSWTISATGAYIKLHQNGKNVRSANLIYARKGQDEFRLWEVGFMSLEPIQLATPFAIDSPYGLKNIDLALSSTTHIYSPAYLPRLVDGAEHFHEFESRWRERLAQVATGSYRAPSQLPEE